MILETRAELISGPAVLGLTSPHMSNTYLHMTARKEALHCHFSGRGLVSHHQKQDSRWYRYST